MKFQMAEFFKHGDEPPTLFLCNMNFLRLTLHHKVHGHGNKRYQNQGTHSGFDEHLSRLGFDTVTG